MTVSNEAIAQAIAVRFNIEESRIVPDASLEDLGFDSLSQVDLAQLLRKKLGVQISDAQLSEVATVGDVLALANGKA